MGTILAYVKEINSVMDLENCLESKQNSVDVTQWLADYSHGDEGAFHHVFEALLPELRRQARYQLRSGGNKPATLSTNVIVNEAFLKLVVSNGQTATNRKHFLRISAKAMRQIIIDYIRQKQTSKRGDGKYDLDFDDLQPFQMADIARVENADANLVSLLYVEQLLRSLGEADSALVDVIEARYFVGLTEREIADALDIPYRTVQRKVSVAKAILRDLVDKNSG